MIQVVPPLNAFIAFLYLACSGLTLYFYKKAVKPLKQLSKSLRKQLLDSTKPQISYDKLFFISWLKKYTLVGSCFSKDKKFLLKQFVFIGLYAITCLHVNHMIIWPISLSVLLLIFSFIAFQIVVSRYQQQGVGEKSINKLIANQVQSEIQIQTVNIESQNKVKPTDQAKLDYKKSRSMAEIITISVFCFGSIFMMLQTMFTLAKSFSNSGQLNITSVSAIIALDQVALRPVCGGIAWAAYKFVTFVTQINPQQFPLIQLMCSQQITDILIQSQKARLKKLAEMTASPPKKKCQSPSKVPKALGLSGDGPTYLNLISLQATKRQDQQAQDEQIQNIYLTTAQKELFEAKDTIENKSGLQTRRKRNKQNNDIYSLSAAQKGTTIDLSQNHDIILIREDPLHEIEYNHVDQFHLEQNDGATKRKFPGYKKKKNQRNLKLTGSSPYLEYLPDMLKKVDKYKLDHPKKQNEQNRKSKKIL